MLTLLHRLLHRDCDHVPRDARITIAWLLIVAVTLISLTGERAAAQHFREPQTHFAPPANGYPGHAVTIHPHRTGLGNRLDSNRLDPQRTNRVRALERLHAGGSDTPNRIARLGRIETFPYASIDPIPLTTDPNAHPTGSPYDLSEIQSARQVATQFHLIARSSSEVVAEIARENAVFVDDWIELAETYRELSDRVDEATDKLTTTTRDYEDVNRKLTKYGLTPTVGMMLRHKREQLDDWQIHDSQSLYASEELGRSRQEQLKLELIPYDGSDPSAQSAAILAAAGHDVVDSEYPRLESQLQGLLVQRSYWIGRLQQGFRDYQQALDKLDSTTRASAEVTADYRKLIDRHITWIRSGDPLSTGDLGDLKGGLQTLFDARRSSDFGPTLQRKLKSDPVSGVLLLATFFFLALVRWRAKTWLIGIGSRKRMRDASAKSKQVLSGLLTTLVAFAFPGILFATGHWLGTGVVSESTLHASAGFWAAGLVALLVELLRHLLRDHGYVSKHVKVKLEGRKRATHYLTLFGFGWIVAAYAITVMGAIDHGVWRDSLARCGFIAVMLSVTWTAHLALRPTGGFLESLIAKFGGVVIHRVRIVIYLAGIGFPLGMIALSALGYGYTANELTTRAIITLIGCLLAATWWPCVKILSAHAWRLLTQTRSLDRGDEEGDERTGGAAGTRSEQHLELKHQLAFLCQCALLIGAVLLLGRLWVGILPDVGIRNPVLWTVQETVTQSSIDDSGNTLTRSTLETTPVTAVHLLLAAGTLFVAFQLARLLPGMFDALVLQRVSFDEAMEHFSLVLGRCLLFGFGCFIACRLVGIRWQTIQWLAVGLTIGLGFGLQDVVRNLFGGLIVLFEKPVRLGDLITVGHVTGRVAMQRLRTTVLSDDDGREVIVPNRSFISNEVFNWMGAGRLNVISMEVAVKRDERPADVCRTLQELMVVQPDILLTPAPQATLVCIGKQSQRIEVRAWIEAGQDPSRFRDRLLPVVRRFLSEKNLLAEAQPSQPKLNESSDAKPVETLRPGRKRNRRDAA